METPITPSDVQVFDDDIGNPQAQAVIETVWADAVIIAPCLKQEEFGDGHPERVVKVKFILRGVILGWADAGSGGVRQRGPGDFAETVSTNDGGGKFRPNEMRDLQNLCREYRRVARASTITIALGFDIAPPTVHPFLTDTEGAVW